MIKSGLFFLEKINKSLFKVEIGTHRQRAQAHQSTFYLQERGAKKKFTKRNAEGGISTSAEVEEAYAASSAPPFEKGGRKLLSVLTVLTNSIEKIAVRQRAQTR